MKFATRTAALLSLGTLLATTACTDYVEEFKEEYKAIYGGVVPHDSSEIPFYNSNEDYLVWQGYTQNNINTTTSDGGSITLQTQENTEVIFRGIDAQGTDLTTTNLDDIESLVRKSGAIAGVLTSNDGNEASASINFHFNSKFDLSHEENYNGLAIVLGSSYSNVRVCLQSVDENEPGEYIHEYCSPIDGMGGNTQPHVVKVSFTNLEIYNGYEEFNSFMSKVDGIKLSFTGESGSDFGFKIVALGFYYDGTPFLRSSDSQELESSASVNPASSASVKPTSSSQETATGYDFTWDYKSGTTVSMWLNGKTIEAPWFAQITNGDKASFGEYSTLESVLENTESIQLNMDSANNESKIYFEFEQQNVSSWKGLCVYYLWNTNGNSIKDSAVAKLSITSNNVDYSVELPSNQSSKLIKCFEFNEFKSKKGSIPNISNTWINQVAISFDSMTVDRTFHLYSMSEYKVMKGLSDNLYVSGLGSCQASEEQVIEGTEISWKFTPKAISVSEASKANYRWIDAATKDTVCKDMNCTSNSVSSMWLQVKLSDGRYQLMSCGNVTFAPFYWNYEIPGNWYTYSNGFDLVGVTDTYTFPDSLNSKCKGICLKYDKSDNNETGRYLSLNYPINSTANDPHTGSNINAWQGLCITYSSTDSAFLAIRNTDVGTTDLTYTDYLYFGLSATNGLVTTVNAKWDVFNTFSGKSNKSKDEYLKTANLILYEISDKTKKDALGYLSIHEIAGFGQCKNKDNYQYPDYDAIFGVTASSSSSSNSEEPTSSSSEP